MMTPDYHGKRIVDLFVSVFGLVFAAPALLAAAVAVRLGMGRPVMFRQLRAGRDGEPFEMWKFRTMTDAVDCNGQLLPDEERLTPLGAFLRSTSLDELPSLVNVVRGEMSIVGPRPLPVRYVERYDEQQRKRLLVRPGITGLAQANGRNALSWEDRFALDVDYVQRASLRLDLSVVSLTIASVLRRSNVVRSDGKAMPEFSGAASGESPTTHRRSC